jgi:hypothetical protein
MTLIKNLGCHSHLDDLWWDAAHPPRRQHKHILQEIYHTEPVLPSYIRWSETVVMYNRADHPRPHSTSRGLPPRDGAFVWH